MFTAASLPPQTGGSNSMYLPSALRFVHLRWPIPFLTLLIPKGSYSRKKKGVNFNGVGVVREAGGGERRRAARWKPPDPRISSPGLFWVWGLRFFQMKRKKQQSRQQRGTAGYPLIFTRSWPFRERATRKTRLTENVFAY